MLADISKVTVHWQDVTQGTSVKSKQDSTDAKKPRIVNMPIIMNDYQRIGLRAKKAMEYIY